MEDMIFGHSFEITAVVLFGIGMMGLLFHKNLLKKFICFNIMDSSIYLFLAQRGFVYGRLSPVLGENLEPNVSQYINPIPAGLVLTGIVVSVSVTAFSLALVLKLYEKYHTLDVDKIARINHMLKIERQRSEH